MEGSLFFGLKEFVKLELESELGFWSVKKLFDCGWNFSVLERDSELL